MPQIVTAQIANTDVNLPFNTPTKLNNPKIVVLTGSGWITLELFLSFIGPTSQSGDALIALVIDGVVSTLDSGGFGTFFLHQQIPLSALLTRTMRLGAGEHTIEIQVDCDAEGAIIYNRACFLTLTEHGF